MDKKLRFKYALITFFVVTQIVSFFRISSLQHQLNRQENHLNSLLFQISNLNNNLHTNLNFALRQMDEMLRQNLGLFEAASTEILAVDADALEMSLAFSLMPREVSEFTAISLDFGDYVVAMARDGKIFTAEVSRGILSNTTPMIVIDEGGTTNVRTDGRIGIENVKATIFPTIRPQFSGEHSSSRIGNITTINLNGNISLGIQNPANFFNSFVSIQSFLKIDEAVIESQEIAIVSRVPVEGVFTLEGGQVFSVSIVATDSLGFQHHYISRTTMGNLFGGSNYTVAIYSPQGEVIWQGWPSLIFPRR